MGGRDEDGQLIGSGLCQVEAAVGRRLGEGVLDIRVLLPRHARHGEPAVGVVSRKVRRGHDAGSCVVGAWRGRSAHGQQGRERQLSEGHDRANSEEDLNCIKKKSVVKLESVQLEANEQEEKGEPISSLA